MDHQKSIFSFGSLIPINGVLKNLYDEHSILVGDAGGFCGAFAADGIKGAVVSGKAAAKLIPQHLNGNKNALSKYKKEINKYQKLIIYYHKQRFYRWVWNRMKKDRTFHAMYDIIAKSKNDFLHQFCDCKDKAKSLLTVVLKFKNIPLIIKYVFYIFLDLFVRRR